MASGISPWTAGALTRSDTRASAGIAARIGIKRSEATTINLLYNAGGTAWDSCESVKRPSAAASPPGEPGGEG
jgi:hypothetical protein